MDPRQGVHNKGIRLDSTPQSWPPIAPKDHGAERTRGRCLGRTEEPVGIHGAVPCHLVQTAHCRPQCCQKHDVVVKLSLQSVCWQEEPPATQDTCRLVAEARGASRGKLPKTSAFCPLPSALCSLSSALCPQPSLRFCSIVEASVLWVGGGGHCLTSSRPSVQLCNRAPVRNCA
jgi:hypothetical protein